MRIVGVVITKKLAGEPPMAIGYVFISGRYLIIWIINSTDEISAFEYFSAVE